METKIRMRLLRDKIKLTAIKRKELLEEQREYRRELHNLERGVKE